MTSHTSHPHTPHYHPHHHAPHEPGPLVDPVDPHGFGHHGHTIVSLGKLGAVLTALLIFTALTVGLSVAERHIAATFGVHFPQWVNIAIVMSIAIVKSALVAMYFMQLRYDKPLNAIVFLFCLFGVGLFLGLTMLDLRTFGITDPRNRVLITPGGTGLLHTEGTPIAIWARERAITQLGPEAYEAKAAAKHHHAPPRPPVSDHNRSRPRHEPTGLFGGAPGESHAPPQRTGH